MTNYNCQTHLSFSLGTSDDANAVTISKQLDIFVQFIMFNYLQVQTCLLLIMHSKQSLFFFDSKGFLEYVQASPSRPSNIFVCWSSNTVKNSQFLRKFKLNLSFSYHFLNIAFHANHCAFKLTYAYNFYSLLYMCVFLFI